MHAVLGALGARATLISTLKDEGQGNRSWLIKSDGRPDVVLRRYHERATAQDVGYEHAVLEHLTRGGWVVPAAVSPLIDHDGALWCLTRFVPGQPAEPESPEQRRRRGFDLARLQVALQGLAETIGQRPGWRPQHTATTVHLDIDWPACLDALEAVDRRLRHWASTASEDLAAELARLGAEDLGVSVIHGDFTSWNVHYFEDHSLAGVIDLGLTHLDSRPYELAIARTYRAPEMIEAYRTEIARLGWPLTPLEEALIEPMQRAFRVDMAAWSMDQGVRAGTFDLEMIERQLARTGPAPP